MSKKLRPKQLRFIAEYLRDQNGTQAAIRAGYSARSAASIAEENLKKPDIRAEVDRRLEELMERSIMTKKEVLREMSRIGRADLSEVTDEEGHLLPLREMPEEIRRAIASIEVDDLGKRKIRLWSKTEALRDLGKFHKLLGAEVEVNVSLADKLNAARKRLKQDSARG